MTPEELAAIRNELVDEAIEQGLRPAPQVLALVAAVERLTARLDKVRQVAADLMGEAIDLPFPSPARKAKYDASGRIAQAIDGRKTSEQQERGDLRSGRSRPEHRKPQEGETNEAV